MGETQEYRVVVMVFDKSNTADEIAPVAYGRPVAYGLDGNSYRRWKAVLEGNKPRRR